MAEFTMPSLGADMDSGTLVQWLVSPGDTVHKGDIVAVVDTDKAAVEVETFQEGVVETLLVDEGTEVPVGTPLATIVADAQAPAPVAAPTRSAEPARATAAPPSPPSPPASVRPPSPREPARVTSPLVRRRAAELGIDLSTVVGTGRGGSVTRADLERATRAEPVVAAPPNGASSPTADRAPVSPYARRLAAELGVDLDALTARGTPVRSADVLQAAQAAGSVPAPPPTAPPAETTPKADRHAEQATGMRLAIARLMARSKREIPHYYLATTVDLQASLLWMHEQNAGLSLAERLVPAALLLKATALAAREHPQLNGTWVDDAFVPGPGIHLGVAVSLRSGGMVAPALHDAPDLTLTELMAALRDLVSRARSGRLRGSELADPTLTVTNLGDQGVDTVFGVIYPPQVALVGFGKVTEQPVAVAGLVESRPVTQLTLAADHRATDGFTGSRFLATIDRLLQRPEDL